MHYVPTQHYNAVHTDPLLVPHGTTKCCASEGPSSQVLVGQISDVGTEIKVVKCKRCKSIETNSYSVFVQPLNSMCFHLITVKAEVQPRKKQPLHL